MMFSKDDIIVYGAIGVCEIIDITESKIAGVKRMYYVLRPLDTDKSIIYVPIDNETLVGRMRGVRSAQQTKELIATTGDTELDWIVDTNERNEIYHKVISQGKTEEIIKLVRAIHSHMLLQESKAKRLSKSDERIYKDAIKVLYNEFSNVMSITQEEMIAMILYTGESLKQAN